MHVFGKSRPAVADRGVLSAHRTIMTRKSITATSMSAALVLGAAFAAATAPAPVDAADPVEQGRFVWHDLRTKDVIAAKRFYGDLLGWRFEDTKRGDRPYVLARSGGTLVAGIVDVSANANAGPQALSYMSVAPGDKPVE